MGVCGKQTLGFNRAAPLRELPQPEMNLELQQGRAELCRDRRLDKRHYLFIDMDFL